MNSLQPYVQSLRAELDADVVTLLLYSGSNGDRQTQLLRAGDGPEIPEFQTLEAAEHLINGALSSRKVEMFRSADPECRLICVPVLDTQRDDSASERRHHAVSQPGFWIGIRGSIADAALENRFEWLASTTRLAAEVFALTSWRADPDTGLPDRGEYERALEQYLASGTAAELDVGVVLIQPKILTNQQTTPLLTQAAARTKRVLRASDQLYRYSEATLALPLIGVDEPGLQALCNKLMDGIPGRGQGTEFAERPQDVSWAIAAVHFDCASIEALRTIDCARLVDTALRHCQIESGDRIRVLTSASLLAATNEEPLQGIFTADPVRDYRNMQLLWDVVEHLGYQSNAAELGVEIVNLISKALDVPVCLLEQSDTGVEPRTMITLASSGDLPDHWEQLRRLAAKSIRENGSSSEVVAQIPCHAFCAHSRLSQPLVLMVADPHGRVNGSDERLLDSLIRQLASAVERLRIAEQEYGLRENETQALRQQVSALSQTSTLAKPLFRSPVMLAILGQADNWAATHETLLITGESGAGKEIMATRLHQKSLRADAPMVTVDCAAIPGTLLEAELFGRVKGAYTGADSASEGYVRKADGGTLLLDEIGELPIDLQSKLLRFVQEKQVSPVGSTEVHQVDVRIIAATNRDLASEVAAGRFRADLMYRLQVLEVHLPPLRERREDIDPLAQYFLDGYNQQYERHCILSEAAQAHLLSYSWPGNVRELKHSMLKACLECSNDVIEPADIGFANSILGRQSFPGMSDPATSPAALSTMAQPQSATSLWQLLEQTLRSSCEAAVRDELRLPIGTWVTEAMVRAANQCVGGVAKHGAELLHLPESTYRRQLERIRQSDASGLAVQHPLFQPNVEIIGDLLAATQAEKRNDPEADSLVDQARNILLHIVATLLPEQSSFGAALMGVTAPTYRRHLKEHGPGVVNRTSVEEPRP